MPVERVGLDWIRVEGRHRKDLGDLESLAQSMKDNGLINAVTITAQGILLAGGRRIAAARMLGWTHIDAQVVDTFDDAARALLIERDENTERKAMTPSELVALGRALEALENPERTERRRLAGRIAAAKRLGRPIDDGISSADAQDIQGSMRTRIEVSGAIGMPETAYYKAREVVKATTDPDLTEAERKFAAQTQADMDAGRTTISGAYDRIKKGVRTGSARQRENVTITKLAAQRRAISTAEAALSGIAHAVSQITDLHEEITNEEATRWAGSLSESRRAITTLINILKERSSGTT